MDIESYSGARGPSGPPTSAHKVIGTLNIIFASLVLLCGICTGFNLAMQAAMMPMFEGMQGPMQEARSAQFKQEHEQQIAELKQQVEDATTDEERDLLESQLDVLEQQQPFDVPDFDMMAPYKDPQIIGYMWTDLGTAAVLNILLLISGAGLLAAKAWARKLAIWTAALKIFRLITLYGYCIAVVVPIYSQKVSEVTEKFATMAPRRPGAPPMQPIGQSMGTFLGIAMSTGAVLTILFGSIYPIIMLWVLTRPKVKAACGEPDVPRPAGLP